MSGPATSYAEISKAIEGLIEGDVDRAAMVFRAAVLRIAQTKGEAAARAAVERIIAEVVAQRLPADRGPR